MSTIIIDILVARQRVEDKCQPNDDPKLTTEEIDRIMAEAKRGSIWTTATAYSIGDYVIPTTNKRNGLQYRVVRLNGSGVQSGATEPTWPSGREDRVTDGNLTWEEAGVERDLWDIYGAIRAAWLEKAAKAAKRFDATVADQSYDRSQLIGHCQTMADQYLAPAVW